MLAVFVTVGLDRCCIAPIPVLCAPPPRARAQGSRRDTRPPIELHMEGTLGLDDTSGLDALLVCLSWLQHVQKLSSDVAVGEGDVAHVLQIAHGLTEEEKIIEWRRAVIDHLGPVGRIPSSSPLA